MGLIKVAANPFESDRCESYKHTGPFIDWLLEHYPNGFPGNHAAAFNGKRLKVEDYDIRVDDGDVVALAILPGWVVGLSAPLYIKILAAIVNTAIAIGLSYAVNALFGTEASKPQTLDSVATKSTPTAGSVYSVSAPTNVARIGEVIPVCYGKNWVYPNQGMQPYAYFYKNEQYLCQLQVIGLGEYEIHNVKVGGSYAAELPDGVLDYWIYPPSAHKNKFGLIQAQTGVYENVYTSSEVSDQELLADLTGGALVQANVYNGCWPAGDGDCGYYGRQFPVIVFAEEQQYWYSLRDEGKVFYVYFSEGPNAGKAWNIAYMYGPPGRYEEWHYILGYGAEPWNGSYAGIVSLSLSDDLANPQAGPIIGPFSASPPCTQTELIQCDLSMPGGVYVTTDEGELGAWEIAVVFTVESIDNNGVPTGYATTYEWREKIGTNTPQRRTIDIPVPKARYRVSAQRITPISERGQDASKCYWISLKSILGTYCDSQKPVYVNTTLIVSRIKATQGISSNATNRIMVSCTRKLDGYSSRHPVDAFQDIYLDKQYGAARTESELDLADLAVTKAQTLECKFDAIYDQETSVYSAMKLAGQMIRGVPVQRAGLVSMARDKPHTVPVTGFNEDNMNNLVCSYEFSAVDDYDGIEGEYVDPIDSSKQYITYPATASNPDSVQLWGCTSAARGQCVLEQLWKQRVYRRRLITFETELDAFTVFFGDPINVQHRLLGSTPILHVVSSVTIKDEFTASIEAFRYDHRVFL